MRPAYRIQAVNSRFGTASWPYDERMVIGGGLVIYNPVSDRFEGKVKYIILETDHIEPGPPPVTILKDTLKTVNVDFGSDLVLNITGDFIEQWTGGIPIVGSDGYCYPLWDNQAAPSSGEPWNGAAPAKFWTISHMNRQMRATALTTTITIWFRGFGAAWLDNKGCDIPVGTVITESGWTYDIDSDVATGVLDMTGVQSGEPHIPTYNVIRHGGAFSWNLWSSWYNKLTGGTAMGPGQFAINPLIPIFGFFSNPKAPGMKNFHLGNYGGTCSEFITTRPCCRIEISG